MCHLAYGAKPLPQGEGGVERSQLMRNPNAFLGHPVPEGRFPEVQGGLQRHRTQSVP